MWFWCWVLSGTCIPPSYSCRGREQEHLTDLVLAAEPGLTYVSFRYCVLRQFCPTVPGDQISILFFAFPLNIFLNCGKLFYLWLIIADVIKNNECNIFLTRDWSGSFSGGRCLNYIEWPGTVRLHTLVCLHNSKTAATWFMYLIGGCPPPHSVNFSKWKPCSWELQRACVMERENEGFK